MPAGGTRALSVVHDVFAQASASALIRPTGIFMRSPRS